MTICIRDTSLILAKQPHRPNRFLCGVLGGQVNAMQPAHAVTTPVQNLEGPPVRVSLSTVHPHLMIMVVRTCIRVSFVACCLWHVAYSQDGQPRAGIQFLGTVLSVDSEHHTVTIKHAKIPGYAVQGISAYSVDKEAVLKSLHHGDDIRVLRSTRTKILYITFESSTVVMPNR